MKKVFLLLITGFLIFSSCSKKVDGTSDESMKISLEEMKKEMSEEEKEKFNEAIGLIAFEGVTLSDIMKDGGAENTSSSLREKLNGKTVQEILSEGERINTEIERKKEEQAKQEIAELYEKQAKSESDKKKLLSFEVIRSRYYKYDAGNKYFSNIKPIIELTVKNGTSHAISRAYFVGTVSSSGRSVPWIKEDFNYQIPGGLEPGEEVEWSLAPNQFSAWGKSETPKDAILTVEVVRLDDANGEILYSSEGFSETDTERLQALLKEYPQYAQ